MALGSPKQLTLWDRIPTEKFFDRWAARRGIRLHDARLLELEAELDARGREADLDSQGLQRREALSRREPESVREKVLAGLAVVGLTVGLFWVMGRLGARSG